MSEIEIVNAGFVIEDEIDGEKILKNIERAGRTCYKSEDKITSDSSKKFVAMIIKSGHDSVIEHEKVTVRVICDRGVTHEFVRHRIGSYSQESTRYCNYKSKGIKFIKPLFFEEDSEKYKLWQKAMENTADIYNLLIASGATPQEARSVLPNSLKTEIVVTFNLREWKHFFRLRCSKKAHPQMREVSVPLLREFKRLIPIIFDDISEE